MQTWHTRGDDPASHHPVTRVRVLQRALQLSQLVGRCVHLDASAPEAHRGRACRCRCDRHQDALGTAGRERHAELRRTESAAVLAAMQPWLYELAANTA